MALGFAGLGYAAQRALVMAKKVAPTAEGAAVEAAKVEACVAKVVDTPFITEPSSSVSSVHREDLRKGSKATNGHAKGGAVEDGHSHAISSTVNGYRQPEVQHLLTRAEVLSLTVMCSVAVVVFSAPLPQACASSVIR